MDQRPRPSYAFRRAGLHAAHALAGGEIAFGDLRIEMESMMVTLGGRPVRLTLQEFDLLVLLAREADTPVSHDRLAQAMWRDSTPQRKRQISVLVARLRSKLSTSRSFQLLAVRKRGYGLVFAARSPAVLARPTGTYLDSRKERKA